MSAPAYCTTCSEELEEGLRFCTSCGSPVDDVDDVDDLDDVHDDVDEPAAPLTPAADVVIRRGTRRSPLLPPLQHEEDEEDVVISRSWATVARNRAIPNQVGKARKIAGDLPAWEPLPPGEAVVTRRSTKRSTG